MSEGMNKVILMGGVCADPELRHTQGGTAVMSIRLATTERVKKGEQWEDHTEYHSVVVWGKRAEGLAKVLAKGSQIVIEGQLRTSSYEAKDGSGKRYKTEIHASSVLLAGRPPQRDGDAPREQRREPQRQGQHRTMPADDYAGDSDLPF